MECTQFFDSLGFSCELINAPNGEFLYVSLPFTLSDGTTLSWYIQEKEDDCLKITDDCDTIFALINAGFKLESKSRWHTIINLATRYGFEVSDSGEITALFNKRSLSQYIENGLSLFASIKEWQVNKIEQLDKEHELTDFVGKLLGALYQTSILEKNPKLEGLGGAKYNFHFKLDQTYIDAFYPTGNATNSRIRKYVDLRRLDDPIDVMYILDDRKVGESFDREMGVIDSVVDKTVRLSELESQAERAGIQIH